MIDILIPGLTHIAPLGHNVNLSANARNLISSALKGQSTNIPKIPRLMHGWLDSEFATLTLNVEEQLPFASIARLGEETNGSIEINSRQWLRADPVHFLMRRNALTLGLLPTNMSQAACVSSEESLALAQSINAFIADEGLKIEAVAPDRWYIEFPIDVDLPRTTPLLNAAGMNVFEHLPQKMMGVQHDFQRLGNEIQMLLHDHPVNQSRELRGLPTVNALWFWGGGGLKSTVPALRVFDVISCDDPFYIPFANGLAKLTGATFSDIESLASNLSRHHKKSTVSKIATSRSLILATQLLRPLVTDDAAEYDLAINIIAKIVVKVQSQLNSKNIQSFRVWDFPAFENADISTQIDLISHCYTVSSHSRYKFWARPPKI